MSAITVPGNNTNVPLVAGGTFLGKSSPCQLYTNLLITVISDKLCELTIQQSTDSVNWDLHSLWTCDPLYSPTGFIIQEPVAMPFFRIKLVNLSAETMTTLRLTSTLNMVSNIKLTPRQDNTLVSGKDSLGTIHTLLTDSLGKLEVNANVVPSGTQDVNVVSAPHLLNTTDSILDYGQNGDYVFYPTASNITASTTGGETAPVSVTGGWSYSNLATGKINWYMYGVPANATGKHVSSLESMYTVINQKSSLGLSVAQNPFVIVYTKPDSLPNASWYKSKLFFGSNAFTDTQGMKLLYTGSDPNHIHPEITGTNRIQLQFNLSLSTKSLADASNEEIWLGSLQTTNNTTPAGSFNFVMTEFGVTWLKVNTPIKIENGLLMTSNVKPPSLTSVLATQNISAVSGYTSQSFDTMDYSVVDILVTPTTLTSGGTVGLEYSLDNVSWARDYSNAKTISTSDTSVCYIGVRSGSRYVRVWSGGPSNTLNVTANISFSAKYT